MNEDKFRKYLDCFDASLQEIIQEMSGFQITKRAPAGFSAERRFSVIIGIVPTDKGRILFEAEQNLVTGITEGMNGGPLDSIMDTYLYLAEFANTFCGNALSQINNIYKGNELRLTPPALFAGSNMRIITPSVWSDSVFYTSEFGQAVLNVGFEGV